MSSSKTIELIEGALAAGTPELAALLDRIHALRKDLGDRFTKLATEPERYADERDELERLDRERRDTLERIGELAVGMLAVRSADAPAVCVPDVVVEASAPDAQPLSERQLDEYLAAAPPSESPRSPTHDRAIVHSLANHVTISAERPLDLGAEIVQFERATSESRVASWLKMTKPMQVRWVQILVAWGKALEIEAADEDRRRVIDGFARLRDYSLRDSPGFIYGFARAHVPTVTWRADAAASLDALTGRSGPSLVEPRRQVDRDDDDDARVAKIPDDWEHLAQTRGKTAVMFGGDVREERRVALERELRLETLEWVPHHRPRMLQSLAERAANGSVDFILANRFVNHKDTMALEKVSAVPVIVVGSYGVTAVKQGIEEWFARRTSMRRSIA